MPDPVHADRSTTHQPTNQSDSEQSAWRVLALPAPLQWFCALGALLVIGDLATTVYGLEIGLREQNPFVVATMNRFGVWGLVGLKLVAVSWVAIIWRGLGRRYGVAAMAGLMVPQGVAVVLNVVTIAHAI